MNKIELFDFQGLKGGTVSLHSDIPDLASKGFQNRTSSLRVTGDAWIAFTDKNYEGDFAVYGEGSYNNIADFSNKISSIKIIKNGLYDPKITVYQKCHYEGREQELTEAVPSLKSYEMDNMISSHKVQAGAWILYAGENYSGKSMVALAGDHVPDYTQISWDNIVSSLKPIQTALSPN